MTGAFGADDVATLPRLMFRKLRFLMIADICFMDQDTLHRKVVHNPSYEAALCAFRKISLRQTPSHGFPTKIRIPRQRSVVHVLMKDGIPCDESVEVIIPARTVGMRDARKRPSPCEDPGRIGQ